MLATSAQFSSGTAPSPFSSNSAARLAACSNSFAPTAGAAVETEAISNCTCGGRSEIRGPVAPCGPADKLIQWCPSACSIHASIRRIRVSIDGMTGSLSQRLSAPGKEFGSSSGSNQKDHGDHVLVLVGSQKELVLPLERVADRRERMAGRTIQRLERDPHEGEGVFIGPDPM